MKKNSHDCILSTVNAPYRNPVDAKGLAAALGSVEAAQGAFGQVYSFFTEIPHEDQVSFVKAHNVSPDALAELAAHLSGPSGDNIKPPI